MKTLITGASGFIGHHLLRHLAETEKNTPVFSLGLTAPSANESGVKHLACDLTKPEQVAAAIQEIRPRRVFHLAGSARVSPNIGMPEYFASNFLTTAALVAALRKIGSTVDVFLASSVHVYGNPTEEVAETAEPAPASFYGFSKFLAEQAVRSFAQENGEGRVVVGRLYSCIGPDQPEGFVLPDLARRLAGLPKTGNPVLKTGSLSSYRRFIDVRDAVRAFPALLDSARAGKFEIVNIASPHELTVKDVLDILLRVSTRTAKVESSETIGANPFSGLRLSVDKLHRLAPELTFRPIEQTVTDVWNQVGSA